MFFYGYQKEEEKLDYSTNYSLRSHYNSSDLDFSLVHIRLSSTNISSQVHFSFSRGKVFHYYTFRPTMTLHFIYYFYYYRKSWNTLHFWDNDFQS